MPSYLITGTSRGLGLGFATELVCFFAYPFRIDSFELTPCLHGKQLKDPKNLVIATARNTAGSSGLQKLKAEYPSNERLVLLDLDVSKVDSIRAAVKTLEPLLPNGLDNLVSNAGVSYSSMKTFEEMYVLFPLEKSLGFLLIGYPRLVISRSSHLKSSSPSLRHSICCASSFRLCARVRRRRLCLSLRFLARFNSRRICRIL